MMICVYMLIFDSSTCIVKDIVRNACGICALLLGITSVKIIQLNEYGCRDAPCEKSWKRGIPLAILSRIYIIIIIEGPRTRVV